MYKPLDSRLYNYEVVALKCIKEAFYHKSYYVFQPGDITWIHVRDWNKDEMYICPENNRHYANYLKSCFKVININKKSNLKTYLL